MMLVYTISRKHGGFETMNAKNSQERQLKRDIKWAKEALDIVEMTDGKMSFHGISETRKECLPKEYQHMAEWECDDIERYIELRRRDLEHLQNGAWE